MKSTLKIFKQNLKHNSRVEFREPYMLNRISYGFNEELYKELVFLKDTYTKRISYGFNEEFLKEFVFFKDTYTKRVGLAFWPLYVKVG